MVASSVVLLLAACGGGSGPRAVMSDVVSASTTQDMSVFAPQDEGSWPVVFALHGLDGSRTDMTELGTRLAAADALRTLGYHVDLVELQAATHSSPVFHDDAGTGWPVDADDPAGERTVELILDAVDAVEGAGTT